MVQAKRCQSRQKAKDFSINTEAEEETELYTRMSHTRKDRAQLVACSVTYLNMHVTVVENISHSGQARLTASLAALQHPKVLFQDSN